MINLIATLFVLSSQASAPAHVNVELERPHTDGKKITIKLSREKSGELECEAEGVPAHGVTITQLKSLESPLKTEKILASCKRVVRWGKSERCYKEGENEIVDKVIRVCTQI